MLQNIAVTNRKHEAAALLENSVIKQPRVIRGEVQRLRYSCLRYSLLRYSRLDCSLAQCCTQVTDLFAPELRCTTMLLCLSWIVKDFIYYGLQLITPYLFGTADYQLTNKVLHGLCMQI